MAYLLNRPTSEGGVTAVSREFREKKTKGGQADSHAGCAGRGARKRRQETSKKPSVGGKRKRGPPDP